MHTTLPGDPDEIRRIFESFERYRQEAPRGNLKGAAVCIPVGLAGGEPAVGLIKRASALRAHPGQFAFPGGKRDMGETAVKAALRELREELGIVVAEDRILGRLDDFVSRSGYVMSPVIVWVGDMGEIRPNPSEVARAFTISLLHLSSPGIAEWFYVADSSRPALRLAIGSSYLYAPAAAILFQFMETLMGRITRVSDIEQPEFARQ
ncbi:NUDIX hydrolase (plasmid) [Mesorhizobium sp. ORM8.1]